MKPVAVAVAGFTLAALLAWPYLYLYRLDRALAGNDLAELAELVDVDAVRQSVKAQLSQRVERTLGARRGSVLGWIQEGVKQIGERAVDIAVDLEWIRDTLRRPTHRPGAVHPSLLSETTYAFFERWDRFLVRIGDIDENPLRVRMALQRWRWQVVGIYE